MYIKRHFSLPILYFMSWRIILWSLFTGLIAMTAYEYMDWKWVAIPSLPISLIGTAAAFYVGFKNVQSYDRSWEARKIWGGIVNLSRSLGISSKAFFSTEFAPAIVDERNVREEIHIFLYRHMAWLYALKHAMWRRTSWEHEHISSKRQRNYFRKKVPYGEYDKELAQFLNKEELEWVKDKKNACTHLMDLQSQHLTDLKRRGMLDDFRHMEMQKLINELVAEQGRSERIKNTPLPRQFATTSTIFILIFTLLLPFGMITEFEKLGDGRIWLLIPFNLVVCLVFSLMEYVGDYSENPFEGLLNDVPILSIVRNIEIDLKDLIGEEGLPEKIEPVNGVLF